jgi:mannose-6-phosphate isomerase-like protein (cupin superfamily)
VGEAPHARRRHAVVHLDELEAIPGPGTLTWHPVRAHLGIRAFGPNAYTAGEVGHDVVEPHTENAELAHEELYFVARGRATFTIDGESFDAPTGTYVFVPDAASHRHAVAAEPGTTVLSFGGPPTFTPSAWEWTFRAAAVRGESRERARAIIADGLRVHHESPGLCYELACLEATDGRPDAALAALRMALEREPELARYAREDGDFDALRGDPRFRELVG